ncbi:MAG: hypothetical protein GMKNLPBB_02399 [Myxococcota bacterium]|nr:hypothetical protein [Myxococcota bacterium]
MDGKLTQRRGTCHGGGDPRDMRKTGFFLFGRGICYSAGMNKIPSRAHPEPRGEQTRGAPGDRLARNANHEWRERLRNLTSPRLNEFGIDPFGLEPAFLKEALAVTSPVYRKYFRVQTYGIENIPAAGRCMLIANHSGQIPLDGAMIAMALMLDSPQPRIVRAMVEKWVPTIPFVGPFFVRCGQVTGTPENCRRLLEWDECILVFPEGVRGISKLYSQRYQLQEFGYGFMRLALETKAPIIPVGVVGAEEQAPALYNAKGMAKLLGMPALPITPTFPLVPVLGLLPYPTKYHIHFGEPLLFDGDPEDDDDVIGEKVDLVKSAISGLLHKGLKQRKHIFW